MVEMASNNGSRESPGLITARGDTGNHGKWTYLLKVLAVASVLCAFGWVTFSWRWWFVQSIVVDLSNPGRELGPGWQHDLSPLDADVATRDRLAICTVILPGGKRYTHAVDSLMAGSRGGQLQGVYLYFPNERQSVVAQQAREVMQEFKLPTEHFDKWDREYRQQGYPPRAVFERRYPTNWGGICVRTSPSYSDRFPWGLVVSFDLSSHAVYHGTGKM